MFDQLMALQWVKDNIEQFGENVKIFLMSQNRIVIIIIINMYLLILMTEVTSLVQVGTRTTSP